MGTEFVVYKRAVKIVQARMGILSNNERLVTEPRYFEGQVMESLLTNIRSIEPIAYGDDLDAYFLVIDDPNVPPQVNVTERVLLATGDFSRYEKECSDSRYSLFGNLGLFFKYLLVTLERSQCSAPLGTPCSWWWEAPERERPSSSSRDWRTTGRSSVRR
jgi:hypothetical protein